MKRVFGIAFLVIIAFMSGKAFGKLCLADKISSLDEKYNRSQSRIRTLDLWLQQKQANGRIQDFFLRNNFKEIAIYGMGYLGEYLLHDLQENQIIVKYAIDKNADKNVYGIKTVAPDAELERVDAIIVSAVYNFEDIRKLISAKIDCPIISLDDVLGNL